MAGTIGTLQATEAIKYLIGLEDELLLNRLLTYDAKAMNFRVIRLQRDPNCKVCGTKPNARDLLAAASPRSEL